MLNAAKVPITVARSEEVIAIIKEKQQLESNLGKIIGLVVKEVGNSFDKAKVAQLVKRTLSDES